MRMPNRRSFSSTRFAAHCAFSDPPREEASASIVRPSITSGRKGTDLFLDLLERADKKGLGLVLEALVDPVALRAFVR